MIVNDEQRNDILILTVGDNHFKIRLRDTEFHATIESYGMTMHADLTRGHTILDVKFRMDNGVALPPDMLPPDAHLADEALVFSEHLKKL
jgi:hypothetical protein